MKLRTKFDEPQGAVSARFSGTCPRFLRGAASRSARCRRSMWPPNEGRDDERHDDGRLGGGKPIIRSHRAHRGRTCCGRSGAALCARPPHRRRRTLEHGQAPSQERQRQMACMARRQLHRSSAHRQPLHENWPSSGTNSATKTATCCRSQCGRPSTSSSTSKIAVG